MPSVTYDYNGSVVIVTGAARGVGRETTRAFERSGAMVVAADRDQEGLAETVRDLPREQVISIVADITTQAGAQSIVDAAVDTFGRLDFCINNAAVAPHESLLEERVEVWDTVFAVNCRGTFLMTQAAGRVLAAQGQGGRIVNFSSGVTTKGSAGAATYSSSRAATEAFTRVAAIELAVHDILVTCVSPGLIDTQPKPLPPSMAESLGRRIPALPLQRPGQPSEVADVLLWLCSPGSTYVSGSIIHVDGAADVGSRAGHKIIDEDVRYDWVTGRVR